MNDSILDKSLFSPASVPTYKAKSTDVDDMSSQPPSPFKLSSGYNLIKLTQAAKTAVNMNKIKVILVLNVILILLIFTSFFYKKWFVLDETDKHQYWVNFLFVKKSCREGADASSCLSTLYSKFTYEFLNQNCNSDVLTSDNPAHLAHLCSILRSYNFNGLVAFCITSFGILLHFIHIVQMAQVWHQGTTDTLKWISFNSVPYFIALLYFGSLIYWWLFATGASSIGKFGVSFLFYLLSVIAFAPLTIWFKRLVSKGIRGSLVDELLNAEYKYFEQFGHGSDNDEL